jgi:hypothetical protein
MDVILLVWIPDSAGIFQGRSYEGNVRFFSLIDLLEMFMFLLRKNYGVAGFRANGAYMFTPFEV